LAIESHAKKLEMPEASEGFFSIREVKSLEDMNKLLREFGGEPLEPAQLERENQEQQQQREEEEEILEGNEENAERTAELQKAEGSATGEERFDTFAQGLKGTLESKPADQSGKGIKEVVKESKEKEVPKETNSAQENNGKANNAKGKGKGKGKVNHGGDQDDEDDEDGDDGLFKFPRTRHIFDMGSATRDDLLFSPDDAKIFFNKGHVVTIEEKVDGANLGFSLGPNYEIRAQNRSHYVNASSHRQFGQLDSWIEEHRQGLLGILGIEEPGRFVLFGEWLAVKHSVFYSRLPSYFLAFDIYDKSEGKFLSRNEVRGKTESAGIPMVPTVFEGVLKNQQELLNFLEGNSRFTQGFLEGIYCRIDEGQFLKIRGKLVRPDFLQQIETSWTHQEFVKNKLDFSY